MKSGGAAREAAGDLFNQPLTPFGRYNSSMYSLARDEEVGPDQPPATGGMKTRLSPAFNSVSQSQKASLMATLSDD
jgi:hypothetical protein